MPDVKAFVEAMEKMKIPKEAVEQILNVEYQQVELGVKR